jgi:hypothetical protein
MREEVTTDAAAFIDSLDPRQIRQELEELDRRSRALRVLLRSAVARQRVRHRRSRREGTAHAR